ncbi:hypothetical protein M514_11412 [Trichuris suis]|uniref:Elongator complex protein 2 n=1 Tax=Trichuris suis TaxID=68888 RepID=A0A085MUE1_9BILA|nr:hypothetical protein M514_11412 [Trichuris suis]
MRCSVECTYVSVGCSAGPFRVDWGRKYIAFCLSRNIYLLQSQLDDDPAHTLNSRAFHADDVTCLKWMMYGSEATDYLLSSALDGDVILWLAKNGRLEPLAKLQQTGRYASALAGVWIQDLKSSFVVGCASRSGLQFWKDFSPAHYIEYENNPPLCCDIRALDADSSFYLAGGSRDHTIRIWKIRQKSHLCREKCKIVTKQLPIYETEEEACFISLDTVIAGHTDAVTSICWNPKNKYQLLSSSMDKTITFWQYNEESDKWEDQGVIGQIDDVEVGFYGAMFSPSGSSVLAHGYQGCLYCWTFTKSCWRPTFMPTGHFSAVEDLVWDPHGMYLLSCSTDRTTRLFAEWNVSSSKKMFCEIARPQVHGYEIQCLSFLTSEVFVCGAAEKVLRIFMAPRNFVLNVLKHTDVPAKTIEQVFHNNAKSATVAALGLTNRPVYDNAVLHSSTLAGTNANDITPEQRTVADSLARNPETASRPEHATVILWSVDEGVPKGELTGHRLTVTRIAFSPDDSLLLTVSRDRKWCLFLKQSGDFDYTMVLIHSYTKCSHTRVIWDCAWAPCGKCFFTTSRDKRAIAWLFTLRNGEHPELDVIRTSAKVFEDSVTAVDVLPCQLMSLMAHGLVVKRLKFCPRLEKNAAESPVKVRFATCSDDGCVKIYNSWPFPVVVDVCNETKPMPYQRMDEQIVRERTPELVDRSNYSSLKLLLLIAALQNSFCRPPASFPSILASRDFDQLGLTIHLESRHIQNFDLEEYEAL